MEPSYVFPPEMAGGGRPFCASVRNPGSTSPAREARPGSPHADAVPRRSGYLDARGRHGRVSRSSRRVAAALLHNPPMEIVAVGRWLRAPIPEAGQHTSDFGRLRTFDAVLVTVRTNDGAEGFGEAKAAVGLAGDCASLVTTVEREPGPR